MAGGIQTTANFPKGLWPGVKSWWDSAAKGTPNYHTEMFRTEKSDKNYEEYVQAVGLGIAPRKPEGQPIMFDSMQQGFTTRGTNAAYGLGIITTHEELMDNRYLKLTKGRVEKLRRSFHETKQINAANVYGRAFNPAFMGGDGVSLLNIAHPNISGGTWANKLPVDAALSQAALEDMIVLMMQARDDRGFIEPLTGVKLVVHPNNYFNAKRILGTKTSVGSANNDINPLADGYLTGGIVCNPYLPSTGAWYITTDAQDGMIYQEREKLSVWEDNDADTRNYKVAAYERYVFLWANPRGLFGSNAP